MGCGASQPASPLNEGTSTTARPNLPHQLEQAPKGPTRPPNGPEVDPSVENAKKNMVESFTPCGSESSYGESFYDYVMLSPGTQQAIERMAQEIVAGKQGQENEDSDDPAQTLALKKQKEAMSAAKQSSHRTSSVKMRGSSGNLAEAFHDEPKVKMGGQFAKRAPQLEPFLKHIDLVDAEYLIALAEADGIVPSWRALPDCARINANTNLWRIRSWDKEYSLPVLVVSYPRFEKGHPDESGLLLHRLLPILKACVKEAKKHAKTASVGVFWEYMSVPSPTTMEESEIERFVNALGAMPMLLANINTIVIQAGATKKEYDQCAWCHLDRLLCALVKENGCVWDLTKLGASANVTFNECRDKIRAGVRAPMASPDRMQIELCKSVESGALQLARHTDVYVVIGLYTHAFALVFEQFGQLKSKETIYYELWGSAAVDKIVEALEHAGERCKMQKPLKLVFEDCKFNDADKKKFRSPTVKEKIKGTFTISLDPV